MNTHFRPPDQPLTTRAVDDMPRRRWTVAEIDEMVRAGIIYEDERFELIDGDAVPMSPKGNKHEHYKASLNTFWHERKGSTYRLIQETTFRLDTSTFLEPDFVFYDAKVQVPQLAPSNTWHAVEISDSTLNYDTGRKAKIYARFEVPVLWAINVNTLEIHVFEKPSADGYAEHRIVPSHQTLAPDFAPELAVKLSELPLI
jgi:Uma2 family endonuclease